MAEEKKLIRQYMTRRIAAFSRSLGSGIGRGELANLRRGVGRIPGDMPELWGDIFQELPEALLSKTGSPTKAEWAVYTALTLYALHQQSRDISMHVERMNIGASVGMLIKDENDRERISRRFNAFASAADMQEAAYHLRGLVQMLRTSDIPTDYVVLACDLYDYQWDEESRARVRLRWGQDFYRKSSHNTAETTNEQ